MTYPAHWTAEEIREDREERAAIYEYEAGLDRATAELRAGLRPEPPKSKQPELEWSR